MAESYRTNDKENILVTPEGKQFLEKTHQMLIEEALEKGTDKNNKIIDYRTPEQLESVLDLSINGDGVGLDKMLEVFSKTIKYSINTAHPRYFNQLYSGRQLEAVAASWMIEALNTNVHTYECSPVFTITENYVIRKLKEKLGFSEGDGIFLPGGTMCNLCALHLARQAYDNSLSHTGICQSQKMVIFTSEDAHYSVKTGASFLGFGSDNVISVDTDQYGCMIASDLEDKITTARDKGCLPFCVVATAGTTVLGAFDPLQQLADICHNNGIWLHVDGSWGGCVIFSNIHKHLMQGVDSADSVSISFHKMLAAQLQCSAIVVRDKDILRQTHAVRASYLFQDEKHYDTSYDIGKKTIQCGRKADAYKLWSLWKARGDMGLEQMVNGYFELAKYFTERLSARKEFKLVIDKFQCLNVCFWYIPPRLRERQVDNDWWQEMSKVAPSIKKRMVEAGTLAIGYQPLMSKGHVNFFRIILNNPLMTHRDVDLILDEIDRLGRDL